MRGSVVDHHAEALRNANHIIDIERALGIFWEPRLQEVVLNRRPLVDLFNFIYFWLDFPLIVFVGLVLYFFRQHQYTVARDAILLSGAIALVIYNLFPVMPPRLLPTGEFVGTIEKYNQLSYQAQSMSAFVNPYAAVPSLHFGWAMIIGGSIVFATKNPLVRGFGILLPWAQLAAIVFTANHYIADAFVGLVVCLGRPGAGGGDAALGVSGRRQLRRAAVGRRRSCVATVGSTGARRTGACTRGASTPARRRIVGVLAKSPHFSRCGSAMPISVVDNVSRSSG